MFGTIKKILGDKGYGFIAPDDGNDDIFFSRGSMAPRVEFGDLRDGDEVEFRVSQGEKGPRAAFVKPR